VKDADIKNTNQNTAIIGGKKVIVASPQEVKSSVDKLKVQYSKALENLKNR
jgi:hypothetical protein